MKYLLLLAIAGCACGCSTPQAALDMGNNTAGLMSDLSGELRKFRQARVASDNQRRAILQMQAADIALVQMLTEEEMAVRTAAGDTDYLETSKRLKTLSDSYRLRQKDFDDQLAASKAQADALLKPLPDASSKIQAAQRASVLMGTELSSSERMKEAKTFAKTVADAVRANEKKIEDSKKDAADEASKVPPSPK